MLQGKHQKVYLLQSLVMGNRHAHAQFCPPKIQYPLLPMPLYSLMGNTRLCPCPKNFQNNRALLKSMLVYLPTKNPMLASAHAIDFLNRQCLGLLMSENFEVKKLCKIRVIFRKIYLYSYRKKSTQFNSNEKIKCREW